MQRATALISHMRYHSYGTNHFNFIRSNICMLPSYTALDTASSSKRAAFRETLLSSPLFLALIMHPSYVIFLSLTSYLISLFIHY